MDKDLLRLINCWLSNAPESYHYYDNECLFDAIKFAYRNNLLDSLNTIDWEELVKANHPEWCDNYIQEFVKEWSIRIGWFVHLLKSMQKDETIPNYR